MEFISGAIFNKGDKVRATQNTNELIEGETYTVFKVLGEGEVFFSRRYWVADSNRNLRFVKNGHINLTFAN